MEDAEWSAHEFKQLRSEPRQATAALVASARPFDLK